MQVVLDWYQQALDFAANLSAELVFWVGVICASLLIALVVFIVRSNRFHQQESAEAGERLLTSEKNVLELNHHLELQEQNYESRQKYLSEQLDADQRRSSGMEIQLRNLQSSHQLVLSERDVAQEKARQVPALEEKVETKERQLDSLRTENASSASEVSALSVKLSEERKAANDKLKVLEDARERLSKEFEVLANRIFEAKTEKMQQHNKQTLETTLSPLREQLHSFKKKVEDVYDKESRERLSLLHEVSSLKDLNQQMSADALNLTKALKGDNKLQGNWGELVLERVLEDSGLKKGREYELQVKLNTSSGQTQLPDVVVHLPDERDLVIDSKVSLVDYERYCSAEDDDEKKAALLAHIQSMRRHVKGLSIKDYASLEGIRTLDFVFVFVPIEPAFLLAFEHDQTLFKEAYDRNVIVVSPTTLLATLRTVQNLWRYDDQNRNAEKIAAQAGGLHDQFALVLESLDEMGRHIDKTRASYDTLKSRFSQGKGNLVKRTMDLEKLGAKTKRTLPASARNNAEESITESKGKAGPALNAKDPSPKQPNAKKRKASSPTLELAQEKD